ncbi:MAG: SDR family oxidoreductase [Phycisphaerae bacterium]|nr:SDR family oxidoreductase [Phycisphaerae bacterium]
MKTVLITGARGFIGRNLAARLARIEDLTFHLYDVNCGLADLEAWLSQADVIFHLAGVNRPEHVEEFETGNAGFTDQLCKGLYRLGRTPKIIMSSSIQAELDNPYGISKRRGEEYLIAFARQTGAPVSIYRLKNVYGKWCRPNYNSVTATFCHNIAHDLPISISDPAHEIELIYVDDLVDAFIAEMINPKGSDSCYVQDSIPYKRISLGDLAGRIQMYHEMKNNLIVPDFQERFNQCLYATYLSYVEPNRLKYGLTIKTDQRGSLAEFIKSCHFGQIFVSRTHPGITRGNHYHHTKTEKFFVVAGEAVIRMRHIEGNQVVEHRVKGEDYRIVDIPPGYTHSIQNVGEGEMITLFWASEVFNPDHPDTYFLEV